MQQVNILKLVNELNESKTLAENLDIELNTQKEIMRQLEISKKEYIQKLKAELDSIEVRYIRIVDEEKMRAEDFRSRAYENIEQILVLNRTIGRLQEIIV